MVDEILKGLFRLEIPLPKNPLKSLNSYVIKGSGRNLIIDTGLNMKECLEAMRDGLQELSIDLRETDFFITHLHADHIGLVSKLVTDSSQVFFNRPEAENFWSEAAWDQAARYADSVGFPEDELVAAVQNHPGVKHAGNWLPDIKVLQDGDVVEVGDYSFSCLETPGHSRGHICLYEPKMQVLISGDHILNDITSTIQLWSDSYDPLKNYLLSLDKVAQLDVELVLPGHRRLFNNCHERIEELKDHHRRRADEVLRILQDGAQDAYQIAGRMTWDIVCPSWEQFPVSQRWFATGETVAHLKYLQELREVRREEYDGKVRFSLN